MPSPGFADPATAARPPAGNLYFAEDEAVTSTSPGELIPGGVDVPEGHGRAYDVGPVNLMFGEGAVTREGAPIVSATNIQTGRGHVSEILNFHGSPAPWILIGILIVAGMLHLSAGGRAAVRL